MTEHKKDFDAVSGLGAINDNHEALLFVLERYFHPQTTCAEPGDTCPRIEDTFRLLTRNLEREEEIMAAAGYPDLRRHKQEHRKLLGQVGQMLNELNCSEYDNHRVADFLYRWAKRHAGVFDKRFAEFCQERTLNMTQERSG